MNKGYFITGTDTGIGKTIASAKMVANLKAHYFKPIQTGNEEDDDTKTVHQLTNCTFTQPAYSLKLPASPHLASIAENMEIDINKIKLPETTHPIIVEGAGGVMVPITYNFFMLDLIKKFQLPAIVVCRGNLGTLNHTLLTIKALEGAKIEVAGLIINGEITLNNDVELEKLTGLPILHKIPWFQEEELKNYINS